MNREKFYYRLLTGIFCLSLTLFFFVSCGDQSNWCIGTWQGSFQSGNANGKEEFVIKIKKDGTCRVSQTTSLWEAQFEADWESVSEDEIKIFDYVGHFQRNKVVDRYSGNSGRWSMYLKKDGSFFNHQKKFVGRLHKH